MKDYLWNKEGNDPEIEELERLLQPMGFESNGPPEAQVETEEWSFWKKLLPFVAVPAFAAFVFGAVLWQSGQTNIERVAAPEINVERAVVKPIHQPAARPAPAVDVENPKKPAVKKIVNRTMRRKSHYRKTPATRSARSRPKERQETALTREEEEAYEQLVKALTITSSKLMLIREKVDGPDGEDR